MKILSKIIIKIILVLGMIDSAILAITTMAIMFMLAPIALLLATLARASQECVDTLQKTYESFIEDFKSYLER